ncbi:MAG: ABC transporter permease [Methanothrix sp.]|jgi:peptide/nickel transport system permease protein|nr:ABC transporter permease [Methanothrix sp.]
MLRVVLNRFITTIPLLIFISLFSFSLTYLAPGDPAELIMESPHGGYDAKSVEEFRARVGLDQPLHTRYLQWAGKALKGDLGVSYATGQRVIDAIFESFWPTCKLSLFSFMIALMISIPLGILSAVKRGSFIDRIGIIISITGVSIPNFWFAYMLLILFSVKLGWLPVSGYGDGGDLSHILLPSITLGISSAAVMSRMLRASMLEVRSQDYITAAISRGLSDRSIILKHSLRNAVIPIVTIAGLNLGYLLNGSVVIETIFNWPGIGRLMVTSIYQRDYPMIQGCILFVAIIFVFINLTVDVLYCYLNPVIRYETK